MIFTLVSTLIESIEDLIRERVEAVDEAQAAEKRLEEEKENRKFEGEKVTKERFLIWRTGFQEEMARKKEEEREREEEGRKGKPALGAKGGVGVGVTEEGRKLTGKELWERGLVGKVEEDVEEGEDGVVGAGMEKLRVEG